MKCKESMCRFVLGLVLGLVLVLVSISQTIIIRSEILKQKNLYKELRTIQEILLQKIQKLIHL